MSENRSSRLISGRLLLEAAAIVISILLAFSIEAWWGERQEREEEERLLHALVDEFHENKGLIEEARTFHRAVQRAELELMSLAAGSAPAIAADSLDRLLGVVNWWWPPTKFSMGALNSVILGGRLHLIQNEELRREIAGWEAEIAKVHFNEAQDYTTFHEDVMPYLRKNTYLPQISSSTTHRPESADPIPSLVVPRKTQSIDHREILEDPEFQNLLLQKWWVQWDALDEYDVFELRVDGLITQLEEELGLKSQEPR